MVQHILRQAKVFAAAYGKISMAGRRAYKHEGLVPASALYNPTGITKEHRSLLIAWR